MGVSPRRPLRPHPQSWLEINEQTNLANDEIKCLKVCFDLFDTKKQEFLSGDDLGDIMRRWDSGLLRRSWLNFCTRLTRMAPERLNSVSSASCVPPSWSRTLTWRR